MSDQAQTYWEQQKIDPANYCRSAASTRIPDAMLSCTRLAVPCATSTGSATDTRRCGISSRAARPTRPRRRSPN